MTAWQQTPIVENGEPLVPIGPFSDYPRLLSSSIYAGERRDSPYAPHGLAGAVLTPFVREGVARKLDAVARSLPEGLHLLVWDSYRTVETQAALYAHYEREVLRRHPDWTAEQVEAQTQRFVSLPSTDPAHPSPHSTGGAVDLTIVHMSHGPLMKLARAERTIAAARAVGDWKREYRATMEMLDVTRTQSRLLPMGTAFDEVAPATATMYFEERSGLTAGERESAANRRFLRRRMEAVGFHAYAEEWWHFSYGDQMWAHARGETACYGGRSLSPANREFERRRWIHHELQRAWADGRELEGAVPERYERAAAFARSLVPAYSDPRMSVHPVTHVL